MSRKCVFHIAHLRRVHESHKHWGLTLQVRGVGSVWNCHLHCYLKKLQQKPQLYSSVEKEKKSKTSLDRTNHAWRKKQKKNLCILSAAWWFGNLNLPVIQDKSIYKNIVLSKMKPHSTSADFIMICLWPQTSDGLTRKWMYKMALVAAILVNGTMDTWGFLQIYVKVSRSSFRVT